MTDENPKIILYTSQSLRVINTIEQEGTCFSNEGYIKSKYQESATIFLTIYHWFSAKAQNFVEKPQGAQFPYWVFKDPINVDNTGGNLLKLQVPLKQGIYFDMYDWIKILQLNYLGQSVTEEHDFKTKIKEQGLTETQIMTTNFYPQLKAEIFASWDNLFKHHNEVATGKKTEVKSIQAALWQIKKEWVL